MINLIILKLNHANKLKFIYDKMEIYIIFNKIIIYLLLIFSFKIYKIICKVMI